MLWVCASDLRSQHICTIPVPVTGLGLLFAEAFMLSPSLAGSGVWISMASGFDVIKYQAVKGSATYFITVTIFMQLS